MQSDRALGVVGGGAGCAGRDGHAERYGEALSAGAGNSLPVPGFRGRISKDAIVLALILALMGLIMAGYLIFVR